MERLLTTQELADYLGVPRSTLWQWRSRGDGPIAVRIGRHLRYRESDVGSWIAKRVEATGRLRAS